MKTWVQVRDAQQQLAVMAEKLEKKRFKKSELKAEFIRDNEEKLRVHYSQQQLELQKRVQVCVTDLTGSALAPGTMIMRECLGD